MQIRHWGFINLHSNTLLGQQIQHELRGSVVFVDTLRVLEHLDALQVPIKQVRAVHWASLGFGVELRREDGSGLVHHSLVAAIVEVDKVLLEIGVKSAGINGITVVLASNVALTSGQVQRRDVVSTVTVLHLDGASTGGQSQKLVAQADTHDWDRRRLNQSGQVVNGVLAMSWVTRAVRDEDTIEVRSDLVDGEIVRQHSHSRSSANQAAEDILLDTAVDQSDVEGGVGCGDDKWSLGADPLHKVNLARVDEALILICVVLVTDRNPSQGRTLLTEVRDNGTGVNARNGGHTLTRTPLSQALNRGPVAVLLSHIRHNNSGTLDVRGLEVLEEVEFVANVRRNTVVANERLGEDQNLATVGGIGHGLRVANKGGGKDGLARNVGVGTEGDSVENGTILGIASQ